MVIIAVFAQLLAASACKAATSQFDLSSSINIVIGVILGFALTTFREWVIKKKQRKEEMICGLIVVYLQFKQNIKRLSQIKKGFESFQDMSRPFAPTPRLIVLGAENNLQKISLNMKDSQLIYEIIHTIEEHLHINRRWDFACDAFRDAMRVQSVQSGNSDTQFAEIYAADIEACKVVLELTERTATSIYKYLKKCKLEIKINSIENSSMC